MAKYKVCLKSVFALAEELGNARDNQKRNYASSKMLTKRPHFIGALGELLFSLVVREPLDMRLLAGGDGGYDFTMVNVKTSEEHKAKNLIDNIESKFDGWYVFVVVNIEEQYGFIQGYIRASEFKAKATITDFGHGPCLAMPIGELHPFAPQKPIVLDNIYK